MDCDLLAVNRAGKSFSVAETKIDFDYAKETETNVEIKKPAGSWGAWAAYTAFPLRKNSKKEIKIKFEAIRKDVTNTRETKQYVDGGILINEKVQLTYESTLDRILHFRRTGIEEMTSWSWNEVERSVGELNHINAALKIESQEEAGTEGQTETQSIYQTFRRFWYNAEQGDETFLDPVAEDYMFMAKSPDKNGKLVEIGELSLKCSWDAEDIEI